MSESTTRSQDERVRRWFSSAHGRALGTAQSRECAALGANIFGYHALQFSVLESPPRLIGGAQIISRFGLHVNQQGEVSGALRGHVFEMPVATHSVKLVAIHHVHELLQDCEFLLRELERILAPDGIVFMLGMNPLGRMRLARLWQGQSGWPGQRWFSPGQLSRLARNFHFARLLVKPVYLSSIWWERMARQIIRTTRWRGRVVSRFASSYVMVLRKRSQAGPILRARDLRIDTVKGGVHGTATRAFAGCREQDMAGKDR